MHQNAAPPSTRSKWQRIAIAALAVVIGSAGAVVGIAAPAQAAGNVVVSLTFDDGDADQLAAAQVMNGKGLTGTFFIISGSIDQPNYLTQANLATLYAAGNEIGGHTVNHQDLAPLGADAVKRQVCNDRVNLSGWGYPVTSFAYPFASVNAQAEQIVAECGYNSARGLGDLKTAPGTDCADCANAETVPPADAFYTRAADQVDATWTLEQLQKRVTDAEAEGGWVQLTFHHIGDTSGTPDPNNPTINPVLFDQFTTWLASWQDGTTKTVKNVNQVVGGAVKPLVQGPPLAPPPGPGENGTQNPSLETPGTAVNMPQCWWGASFGNNTSAYSTVTPGRTGATASKVTVTNYVDGDAKILALFDESGCAPTVTPGATYSLRAFYMSTANTQFAVYTRNTLGAWTYWTSSTLFPPATIYTQANFTTPAIPDGITGISFGLNLAANGELITDDYAMYDSNGAPLYALSPVPPTVAGTAQVGKLLTATVAPWAPDPVALSYQWNADGVAIAGATGLTFTPTAAQVGKAITFTVSGTKTGYDPLTATSAPTAAVIAADATVVRLGGADRYAVSAAVSASTFAPNVPVAYVASGEVFPDALSGSAAAGKLGGPVLLVTKNTIPSSIGAELARLHPAKIVVLGGVNTVSDGVVASLNGTAPTTRIGGADRYAVSAGVSKAVFAPNVPVVYVASGAVFPDALSGSAAAGKLGGPVLLVTKDSIPAVVKTELNRLHPAKIVVLGGTATVSDSVKNALNGIAPATRIAGADRFAVSAAISATTFTPGVPVVYIASGAVFPDALSGSAAAIVKGGPVLLVNATSIPTAVKTELNRLNPAKIVVLGGSNTVSDALVASLQAYIG
jgi:putative cell wall-binding protein/peptidoglycan/xylan/chitin deacetylase (PgdA/CDA1 family)